jgi:hypothetical protein
MPNYQYQVMPYDGVPECENELNRLEEGPRLLFQVALPLEPTALLGDRVMFMHEGHWWIKTAQMVNHGGSLPGFPPFVLFARPALSLEDEARSATDREAGLVAILDGTRIQTVV